MYRAHRFAPIASTLLLVLLVLLFALGSSSPVTAEEDRATSEPGALVPVDAAAVVSTDPDVVRELVDKRTENSRTFLLKDGRLRSEIFEGPIHFQDKTGAWQVIDTDLLLDVATQEWLSTATPVAVSLVSPGSSGDLVTLKSEGATVGMSPVDMDLTSPLASGNRALYRASDSPYSLRYEVLGSGVKETIVLG